MAEETAFQARALYEFVGQDDTELNFQPDDVLTITSTNVGEGWWFATNADGKVGAVPAAYLEKVLTTVAELVTDVPVAPMITSDEPTEPPPPVWIPPVTNVEITSTEENIPATSETYIEIADSAPLTDPVLYEQQPAPPPLQSFNPFANTPSNAFQFNLNTSRNVVQDTYDVPSYTPQTIQSPTSSHFESFSSPVPAPPMTMNLPESGYTPMFSNSSTEIRTFELPSLTSSSVPPPVSTPEPSRTPVETPLPQTPASPPPAAQKEKKSSRFLTLGRKSKLPDEEKTRPTGDSDSDDFSDSGTHAANSSEAKAAENKAAKARFFDKHGLDSYILSGSKAKFDDHAQIGYNESVGGVYWIPSTTIPPFLCKVEEPHKGTKLGGFKAFIEYGIHTTFAGHRTVNRRYKHFDWLYEQLMLKYRFICIPQLPGKQIAGRFEQEFVEERRRQLELWLNRICQHPVLCASFPVQHFVKCELTEKNNKEWKTGKRKVEKEESRDALWLHCVTLVQNHPSESQIAISIETFAQQEPALETHLKNLSSGLSKFLERHTEIYEKDMQKIGELFAKLHNAAEVDSTTPGNREMANAMMKISASYNAIAQLYKTKASDGVRFFNEHLQEHVGIISCFPAMLQIYRSATEFIRTVQQRGPVATPDYNGAIQRNNILNHVILAEINLFQRDKVRDLHSYMKILINEQIQFYERVTDELRQAATTFH